MEFDSKDLEEEVLAEPDELNTIQSSFNVFTFLQSNAWYIIIFFILLYYLWKNKVSSLLQRWREYEDSVEASKHKKDPDLIKIREEARMAAVERLQNNYNQTAIKMKQIAEEREKKKKEEYILRHSEGFSTGRKLNEDYNPLMDTGGGSRYRAPRRTCPGGSCGNR